MPRTCLLVLLIAGLLAPVACLAADDLYQTREWTNSRNQIIDGQLLAVTTMSAHILCDEEVYDIPLYEFHSTDRGLLLAEVARKQREEGRPVATGMPAPYGSPPMNSYPSSQNSMHGGSYAGSPPYSEGEPLRLDAASIRERLFSPRWHNGNQSAAYHAGQFVGYFSLVAIAIGVLYRFYTS